ncbi:hypothetical protein BV22DRAFT_978258, partial [Leucogyrophana mollusca]
TFGRIPLEVKTVLRDGFLKLDDDVKKLAERTFIPVEQVISLWHKHRTHSVYAPNRWNIYQRYFVSDQITELARLGKDAPPLGGTVTSAMRTKCYELFQRQNKESWTEILDTYEDL